MPPSPFTPATPLALALAVLWSATAYAQPRGDGVSDAPPTRRPGDLAPITESDLETLQRRVAPCVRRVRARTDLGPGFRPRFQEGDGIATWVILEDEPTLVTSFSWLARTDSVEVETAPNQWVAAEAVHGTPLYDLAALRVEAEPSCAPLRVPDGLPLEASLFSCADAACSQVVVNGLGAPVPEEWGFYVRTLLPQRHGPPVFDREGNLIAIASVFAPEGAGTFAIPFRWLEPWRDEWPQLAPTDGTGWQPRVRVETFELRTGSEALP